MDVGGQLGSLRFFVIYSTALAPKYAQKVDLGAKMITCVVNGHRPPFEEIEMGH